MMDKFAKDKKDLRTYGFDDSVLEKLDRWISLDNYHEHVKARDELTSRGTHILPVMHRLVHSDSDIVRKEAAKIIKHIGSRSSLEVAIELLEDPVWDIRWIAAEILIRIGKQSLRPLMKELVEDKHSFYLREGVHHVMFNLLRNDDPKELVELQQILLNSEFQESIPLKASEILHKNLV